MADVSRWQHRLPPRAVDRVPQARVPHVILPEPWHVAGGGSDGVRVGPCLTERGANLGRVLATSTPST